MKTKTQCSVVIVVLVLFLSSCGLEDYISPGNTVFLSKIYSDGLLLSEYNYNSDYQLTIKNDYDSLGNKTGYTEYDYNSEGQVINTRYFDHDGLLYYYYADEFNSKGLLAKSNFYLRQTGSSDPQIYSTNLYEYNASKRCIKITQKDKMDAVRYYYSCEYTGDNCTKVVYYSPTDSLLGHLVYTHDNKKRPYLPLTDIGLSKNNVVRMTSPSIDNTGYVTFRPSKKLSIRFSPYSVTNEYNSSGYPVKRTYHYDMGDDEKQELEYISK